MNSKMFYIAGAISVMMIGGAFANDDWTGPFVTVGAISNDALLRVNLADYTVTGDFIQGVSYSAGYDYQWDQFVIGAEVAVTSQYEDSVRTVDANVRAGYLVTPDILAYATAGVEHNLTINENSSLFGAGLEYAVSDNVGLRLQYQTDNVFDSDESEINRVTASLIYRF